MFSGLYSRLFGPTLLTEHPASVRCLAVSPDGSLAASGSGEPAYTPSKAARASLGAKPRGPTGCVLRVIDLRTRRVVFLREFETPVDRVAFSADGRLLEVAVDPGGCWLDVSDPAAIRPADPGNTGAVGLLPGGRGVLVLSDDSPALWDPGTGKVVRRFNGLPPMSDRSLKLSRDGRRIVGRSGDTVHVVDAATGAVLRSWSLPDGMDCADVSPDGGHVLAAGGKWVQHDADIQPEGVLYADFAVFSVETGELVKRLPCADVVTRAVFSPDGRLILYRCLGSQEGAAILVEWRTGRVVKRFGSPIAHVADLLFIPDGRAALFSTFGRQVWLAKV